MKENHLHSDGLGFLQTAEASLRIREHMDLFLWLQGDVQKFLPHDVLIAAWGDFGANNISFDVISPLPSLRTENLYSLCNTGTPDADACKGRREALGERKCGAIPFLVAMRGRWHDVGCSPYVAVRGQGEDVMDFIPPACDPAVADVLGAMRSCLVHGFSDQRGKFECIYVFLSKEELSDPLFRRSLRFLLPYLDYSLRQVSHLPVQLADAEPAVADREEPADSSGLSTRENEIMEWVRIGKTNYEIGIILNISAFTVKNHLQRIFKKLDATNRAQAVEKLSRTKHHGRVG